MCSLGLTPAVSRGAPPRAPVVTGRRGGLGRGLGRALVRAPGQANARRGAQHGLGTRRAGGAAQTSVLMLRLREKASRMADRRLGLSACRPAKLAGGSSASSWLMLW